MLRIPVPTRGAGYIYDIATLTLQPEQGEALTVSARILRIEADPEERDAERKVLMALEYSVMDSGARKSLRQYLQMYDPGPGD